jgi:hypothetical protein
LDSNVHIGKAERDDRKGNGKWINLRWTVVKLSLPGSVPGREVCVP